MSGTGGGCRAGSALRDQQFGTFCCSCRLLVGRLGEVGPSICLAFPVLCVVTEAGPEGQMFQKSDLKAVFFPRSSEESAKDKTGPELQ